ncbi:hypothetical protein [Rubneribacter sp.]|nr:hypothetical protein [Candidatus Rubneribacter avistercoris]
MKILGMGIPELLSLLPFLALGAAVYALMSFLKSRKVATSLSGDAQVQNMEKQKYTRRAIIGIAIALICVALTGFHICDSCHTIFFGKSYANYYSSTLCPDCARYSTFGVLS